MRIIKKGAASQSLYVEILDSTSTTGGRKTGLVFNSAGLGAYYARNQGSATQIVLQTLAAANSAWATGGFKEVDAANMPGVYRLDVPDAAVAAGAGDDVTITIKGATGAAQVSIGVQLVAYDPQDATALGISRIDAAISSRLASASYTAPDNATITAINAKTTNLPASPAATSDIPTPNQNADALLDRAAGIETNRTLRQGLRLMLAAIAGKASGLATATATYRDTNDSKDRIVATVDADGNRTAVTLDAS